MEKTKIMRAVRETASWSYVVGIASGIAIVSLFSNVTYGSVIGAIILSVAALMVFEYTQN